MNGVWLEERNGPDFVEVGSSGALDHEALIALILGNDPGAWAAEDFSVRAAANVDSAPFDILLLSRPSEYSSPDAPSCGRRRCTTRPSLRTTASTATKVD